MGGGICVEVFCDPMMGLLYESEPIMDGLARTFGAMVEIRYIMAVLVEDVFDFMSVEERLMGPGEGIRRYCTRLAAIYKSEEAIAGLPITMEGFRLFDEAHRSSRPLCLAYKAAQLTDGGTANAFLRALTHATVCDCRPTTHEDVILDVARSVGLDENAFARHLGDGGAAAALEQDLRYTRLMNVRSLPTYRIRHGGKSAMLQGFDYRDLVEAISVLMA